jgi:Gas vesicle protein
MADFDQVPLRPGLPQAHGRNAPQSNGPANLADILERVLDKGIVIAGDIQINLLDIELLTIKLRLLIASVDRAQEMGINWWESDPSLSRGAQDIENENRELRERLERLERAIGAGDGGAGSGGAGSGTQGYGDRGKTRGARR